MKDSARQLSCSKAEHTQHATRSECQNEPDASLATETRRRPHLSGVVALHELVHGLEAQSSRGVSAPFASCKARGQLQNTLRGVEVLTQVGQIAPVMDYLDGDKMVDYLIDVMGLPAQVVRSEEEVAILRRQQAQQASQGTSSRQAFHTTASMLHVQGPVPMPLP